MKSKVVVFTIILVIIIVCKLIGSIMHKTKISEETFEARESTSSFEEEEEANPVSKSTSEGKKDDLSEIIKEVDKVFWRTRSFMDDNDIFNSYKLKRDVDKHINDLDTFVTLIKIYNRLSLIEYKDLLDLYNMENNRFKFGNFPLMKKIVEDENIYVSDLSGQVLEEKYWNLVRLNYKFFFITLKEPNNNFFPVSFLFARMNYFETTTTTKEFTEKADNLTPIFLFFQTEYPNLTSDIMHLKKTMIVLHNNRPIWVELWRYGIITWYNLCLRYKQMDLQNTIRR